MNNRNCTQTYFSTFQAICFLGRTLVLSFFIIICNISIFHCIFSFSISSLFFLKIIRMCQLQIIIYNFSKKHTSIIPISQSMKNIYINFFIKICNFKQISIISFRIYIFTWIFLLNFNYWFLYITYHST